MLAVALAAAAPGCGESETSVRDPHGTIEVPEGAVLDLTFSISPGVGYGWELVSRPTGGPLAYDGEDTSGFDGGESGGSGVQHYRFRATANGMVKLVFVHDYRGKTVERRTVTVVVD